MWKNRSEIRSLKTVVFGHPEGGDGQIDEIESLAGRLERIEAKIDEEGDQRIQDHQAMRNEVKANRYLMGRSIDSLVVEINRQSEDIDLEQPDNNINDFRGDKSDD